MSLPNRISYCFPACVLLALLVFFLNEARAQSGLPEGQRSSMELGTLSASANTGETPKLELRSFTLETLNDGVHVSMGLGIEHMGSVRSQLRDGAVMTLTCNLDLVRVRTILSNEILSSETRTYQLRHDLLSREFILSSPGTPIAKSSLRRLWLRRGSILNLSSPSGSRLFPGKHTGYSSRSRLSTRKSHRGWKKRFSSGRGK